MKRIAVIMAGGGSGPIPGKDVKDFCGKPILAYSVEAALGAGVFDVVMVSTNDPETAEAARRCGAEAPFFGNGLASSGHAAAGDVLSEILGEYEKRGQCFDIACSISSAAPFVTAEKLRRAMEMLIASNADIVMPVSPFSFPPQRGMVIKGEELVFKHPQYANARSQDLTPCYHDTGQFCCFWTEALKADGKLGRGKILPIIVSELEVQEIDDPIDWEIAEMKYRFRKTRD